MKYFAKSADKGNEKYMTRKQQIFTLLQTIILFKNSFYV